MALERGVRNLSSLWLKDVGTEGEISAVVGKLMNGRIPSSPAEIVVTAETLLAGRVGPQREEGRILLWAAASQGSMRACKRLADELEAHAEGLAAADTTQAERIREQANRWRAQAASIVLGRLDLSGLPTDDGESTVLEFGPPFPSEMLPQSPVEGRSKVVVASVGDRSSPDGSQIMARYSHLVGKALPAVGSLPAPGETARAIAEAWPWASHVGAKIEGRLALLRSVGITQARFKPLLFVGPPGSGKTKLARRLAEMMGQPATLLPAGSASDAGTLSAVARDWRNSRPCAPVLAAAEGKCSNPVLIIDELDKSVAPGSKNGSVLGTLLGMISEADRYYDSCLLTHVDISWVTFMATANDLTAIPEAVWDRFEIVFFDRPSAEHFDIILANMRQSVAAEFGVHPALLPWLDAVEMSALRHSFGDGDSLRSLEHKYRFLLGEAAIREHEARQMMN